MIFQLFGWLFLSQNKCKTCMSNLSWDVFFYVKISTLGDHLPKTIKE